MDSIDCNGRVATGIKGPRDGQDMLDPARGGKFQSHILARCHRSITESEAPRKAAHENTLQLLNLVERQSWRLELLAVRSRRTRAGPDGDAPRVGLSDRGGGVTAAIVAGLSKNSIVSKMHRPSHVRPRIDLAWR